MSNVIHIHNSPEKVEALFNEAMEAIHLALHIFMSIEKDDVCAKVMCSRAYDLLLLGEDFIDGKCPD